MSLDVSDGLPVIIHCTASGGSVHGAGSSPGKSGRLTCVRRAITITGATAEKATAELKKFLYRLGKVPAE